MVGKRHKRSVDKANTTISSDRAISTSCVERVFRRTLPRSTGYSRLVSNDSYDETDDAIGRTTNDFRRKGSCDRGSVRDVHRRDTEEVERVYREKGETKENRGTKRVT